MKNKNYSQTELQEKSDKNSVEDQIVYMTSTPKKLNKRKSCSLLDISVIETALGNPKINVSSDTIASSSCKDSGCDQSESSLSLDKEKVEINDLKKKLCRVMENLKFKEVIISTLHESNHTLRMKLAEAENKITELRLKSESHCRCCVLHNRDSTQSKTTESAPSFFKYSVSPIARSEPNLLITDLATLPAANKMSTRSPGIFPSTHVDDAYIKVQQWQSSFRECNKKLVNQRPKSVSEDPVEPQQIFVRSVPEALPQTMSYMETSRALAETYCKGNELPSNLYSFQVIGDHSVSIPPIVRGHRVIDEQTTTVRHEESKSSIKEGSPREVSEQQLPSRQSILNNIIFRNQRSLGPAAASLEQDRAARSGLPLPRPGSSTFRTVRPPTSSIPSRSSLQVMSKRSRLLVDLARKQYDENIDKELMRRNTIFDTFPLLRFQTHARSSGLSDCLNEANEFATTLADGLSKLPNNLDEIRSISKK